MCDKDVHTQGGRLCTTHLPDSDVCCWVREGPFEHVAHFEGIRVHLSNVIQHHQDSGQRVDAWEQTDVTKKQKELQVVIKGTLKDGEKTRQTYRSTHINESPGTIYSLINTIKMSEKISRTYQICAHMSFEANLLGQR